MRDLCKLLQRGAARHASDAPATAESRQIQLMAVRQGRLLGIAGITIGPLASLAAPLYLGSLIFGISAHDPLTFGLVALLLVVVAVGASWMPVRRATRIDPLVALRSG
jgi:putative ABC transport system permease protein